MKRVMVVDEYEPNLRLYAAVVKRAIGEEPLAYRDPNEALRALETERPELIIIDYCEPEMDGVALTRAIRAIDGHSATPIVMLTDANEPEFKERALAAGAAVSLERPLPLREFMATIRRYTASPPDDVLPLEGASGDRDAIVRLHRALCAFDAQLAARVRCARNLAVELAAHMSMPADDVEALRIAGLVYDIGLLAVPQKALGAPWELSPAWAQTVRGHAKTGAAILGGGSSPLMQLAETLARTHHEHFDGSGYPEGLSGEAIPLAARLLTVADAFAAMTSDRPHRAAMSVPDALAKMKAGSGTAFDPQIVALLQTIRGAAAPAQRSA